MSSEFPKLRRVHRPAITMGDPCGIGPEVTVKALNVARLHHGLRAAVIFGDHAPLARAAKLAGIEVFWRDADADANANADAEANFESSATDFVLSAPSTDSLQDAPENERNISNEVRSGQRSFRWVQEAIALWKRGGCDSVVTAPISKHAWSVAGHGRFPGHTEVFADAFPGNPFAMFFHAPPTPALPGMNVILVTVHIPLAAVAATLTTARIVEAIQLAHAAMVELGTPAPRIGVCGLNPHAGEMGLLGSEDEVVIKPAIRAALASGINVTGPHPGDTIFQRSLIKQHNSQHTYDCVVAMYHDQGLIPLKTLAWDRAVNVTVGLPIIRTSPDHGTAFDIAGQNLADPGSMLAALLLAVRMSRANEGGANEGGA